MKTALLSGRNRAAISALLVCLGLLPSSGPAQSDTSPEFVRRVLATHNKARAAVRSAPLQWDARLAEGATSWARRLAAQAQFAHAPDIGDGENLWTGTRASSSVEAMIGDWIDERKYFRAGRYPSVSTTGEADDVGHYTQLVWSRTTHVGCALAQGAAEDVLVCRYSPAGNVAGQDVLAAKTAPKPVSKRRRRGG